MGACEERREGGIYQVPRDLGGKKGISFDSALHLNHFLALYLGSMLSFQCPLPIASYLELNIRT